MSSETSMVAAGFRLQEWAVQIRECQSRPAGMSVASWCADNGISKANYYYRLRRVRKACLEHIQKESPAQRIVPVKPELLQQEHKDGTRQPGLNISTKGFSVHVQTAVFSGHSGRFLRPVWAIFRGQLLGTQRSKFCSAR